MSKENKGIRGPASMRFRGRKISELPLGQANDIAEGVQAFIQQERINRVNAITARYPRATKEQYDSLIRACEANIEGFKRHRFETLKKMDEYQTLMRNNTGKTMVDLEPAIDAVALNSDLTLEEKMAAIHEIKEELAPFDGQGLWKQIKQFRMDVERYDETIDQERNSIHDLREGLLLIAERDRRISQAMSEPIPVE